MDQNNRPLSDNDDKKKTQGDPNSPIRPGGSNILNFLAVGLILVVIMNMLFNSMTGRKNTTISYTQLLQLVDADLVDTVTQEEAQYLISLKKNADVNKVSAILKPQEQAASADSSIKAETELWKSGGNMQDLAIKDADLLKQTYNTGVISNDLELSERLYQHGVQFTRTVNTSNPIFDFIITFIVPLIFLYFIYWLIMRTLAKRMGSSGGFGGMMDVGKSNAKLYNVEKNTGITFKDVAGEDEAKESLDEIIDFLHHPEKYQKIGAKQPKGALLVGPPGTGKTLLAKAVAGEAHVPFFSLSGSEFVEMFAGVGASRVRDLFQQAEKQAPCIIFIDEIDAIGKSRDNALGSNDEREQTLNQLLAEMDGFDSSKGIVVLAATNRPEVLDKALMRPGRFDRQIIVERPDLPGREAILKVHAAKVIMGSDVDLHEIALSTSGATGADLANMINEAALRAVRLDREYVIQADLMEAVETVIAGKEKKDRILSPKEKLMVAFHEVGHALASALQKDSQPVQKITIVPRTMGSLGYTMQMPEQEKYLLTKSELLAEITTLLAGRAAEELIFNESSTGASNDIERASATARSMVTQYGMSDEFDMMGLESVQSKYLDGRNVSTCSEKTGEKIDSEVLKIIKQCHAKAKELLQNNLDKLREIADFLYEKETISGKQFMEILHANKDNAAIENPAVEAESIAKDIPSHPAEPSTEA